MPTRSHVESLDTGRSRNLDISLPPLPTVLRYHDDFTDTMRSIRDLSTAHRLEIVADGQKLVADLTVFGIAKPLVKHAIVDWVQHADITTVLLRLGSLTGYIRVYGFDAFWTLAAGSPWEAKAHWNSVVRAHAEQHHASALKALLRSFCDLSIGAWSKDQEQFLRTFRLPRKDRYRIVRTGDCFLPLDDQARIVNHIDDQCALLCRSADDISSQDLRDVCILVVAFQYAFRPGQIARIELADVRAFDTGAVHLAVRASKQVDARKRTRVTRRIKREWSPLFAELLKRRRAGEMETPAVPQRLLFALTPIGVSDVIKSLSSAIVGEAWTPTDMRHTAAQRLADAGVAHVELSEFMMHSSIRTANVYFDASPAQAERVNQALAISPIYSAVERIARTGTIDVERLMGLDPDQQIGGVPHGIPVSGIGGCEMGQSLCVKNPVLSCYGCSQFMPLADADIHESVLTQLRPVVTEFAAASRGNNMSPAYAQLRSTMNAVKHVVESLRVTDHESRRDGEAD
jgi:integrase